MDPIDLIHLQIRLEYQIDQDGLLVPFLGSTEQALFLVYHFGQGYQPYFNHRLPMELRQQLLRLGPKEAIEHPRKVIKIISETYQPCKGGEDVFWSGYFTRLPGPDEFPDVVQSEEAWTVRREGKLVSEAISIRHNGECHEAYVHTEPDFRGRGFGRQTVAAWANHVMSAGRVALYSFRHRNHASAALAESLGVKWYADVIGFD